MVEPVKSPGKFRLRRWFRVRFGLRTLLLFTAVVAVWLGLESGRAREQQALVARSETMPVHCRRTPRRWIPRFMHRLLNENQGCFVESVLVNGFVAPTDRTAHLFHPQGEELYAPADIEGLLRLPAMDEVRKLVLSGTSMTDDLVEEIAALDDLESVTFMGTAVSKSGIERLKQLRPDCTIVYSPRGNGPAVVAEIHPEALFITDDLTLFPQALHGDQEAIRELLRSADLDEDEVVKRIYPQDMQAVLEGLRESSSDRPDVSYAELVRLVVEEANRREPWAIQALALHRRRVPSDVSSSWLVNWLADFLAQIDRGSMHGPLDDTIRNAGPKARFLAVEVSARHGDVDLLKEAFDDPAARNRIKAVIRLAGVGGASAVNWIDSACRDPDPKVREVALRELAALAGRASLDTYLEAMADPDANVRRQAVLALKRYPDLRAVETLKGALNDENSLVRCSAAWALGRIADDSGKASLASATEDEDSLVREAAETALRQLEER